MQPSLIEEFVKGIEDLDWDLAIRRNRDQLRAIVLALFALAGMRGGGLSSPLRNAGERSLAQRGGEGAVAIFPLFLPRSTIALIMAVLRPAESAVRRLIVIVASGLALKLSPSSLWGGVRGGGRERSEQENPVADESRIRRFSSGSLSLATPTRRCALPGEPRVSPAFGPAQGGGWAAKYRAFPLFDPLKSFDPDSIWDTHPTYKSSYSLTKSNPWHDASSDQAPTDARHLALRLNAILRALNDLPRQARRLKRWELKRDELLKASKPTRFSPMRPGLPPGWRERRIHDIDDVLKECHRLALDRVNKAETG